MDSNVGRNNFVPPLLWPTFRRNPGTGVLGSYRENEPNNYEWSGQCALMTDFNYKPMELNGDYDYRGLAAYGGPRPGDERRECNNVGGEGRTDYSISHSNDAPISSHSTQSQVSHQLVKPNPKNLIVNYLPLHLTDKDLFELFCSYGDIENVRVIKDKKTGYSAGYGFVRFTREFEASSAISAMNGRKFYNKVLKVSLALPSSEKIKDTNLYINNLEMDVTEGDLRVMFSPFGEIVQQNVLHDKISGLSRGVGFVRFATREQAKAAIEAMNGSMPEGYTKALQVKIAENHGKRHPGYVAGFQEVVVEKLRKTENFT